MEEVRLMESRKSARLMDQHDVDFARLAEGGLLVSASNAMANGHDHPQHHHQQASSQPRKRCSSASTSGIDVPGAYTG